MEIRYYRRAGTKVPAYASDDDEREITRDSVETVVFFIPNLAHLMPSEEAWEQAKAHYNNVLQKLLNPEDDAEMTTKDDKDLNQTQLEASEDAEDNSDETATNAEVQDLRNELLARGLDSKGLKANLSARLQSALDEEKAKDTTDNDDKPVNEAPKAEQTPTKSDTPAPETTQEKAESKQLSEKERRRLERLYRLGDRPTILIHPNKEARGGRFDCHRVTLHALLEYRTDEMKEPNFEVALFAEQFHEMMQRDSAFDIFKAIYCAPEKEQKPEQSGKVNGIAEEGDEPDLKRAKVDGEEHEDDNEITKMKSMVNKVISRRDSIQYHNLTDSDVIEGDTNDVITLDAAADVDVQLSARLSLGNRALLGINTVPQPSIVMLGGGNRDNAMQRVEAAEAMRKKIEYQFFQIKEELEKTRARLNNCKHVEDKLRAENQKLNTQLKDEQKQAVEMRHLYNTYSHLVRFSHDHMTRSVNEINKQYEREKAKREAERAAAEASKVASTEKTAEEAKTEDDGAQKAPVNSTGEAKTEEKDWEVVDTV